MGVFSWGYKFKTSATINASTVVVEASWRSGGGDPEVFSGWQIAGPTEVVGGFLVRETRSSTVGTLKNLCHGMSYVQVDQ